MATPLTADQCASKDGLITLVALGYLLVMFYSGSEPTHENLIQAVSDGVLHSAPHDIVEIEVTRLGDRRRYQRRNAKWYDASINAPLNMTQASELERAITFMRTAAPVRILRPEEIADVDGDPFGLERPLVAIELSTISGPVLSARFGQQAPDGILRYMRLEGQAEVYLMSGFVGNAWQEVASFEESGSRN